MHIHVNISIATTTTEYKPIDAYVGFNRCGDKPRPPNSHWLAVRQTAAVTVRAQLYRLSLSMLKLLLTTSSWEKFHNVRFIRRGTVLHEKV